MVAQHNEDNMSREQDDMTLGASGFFGEPDPSQRARDLDREERERERRQAQDDAARQRAELYHDGMPSNGAPTA